MASSYVPPHLRNRHASKTVEKKVPGSDEFPILGSSAVRSSARPALTRSFALLASEWKDHEEEEKIQKEAKDERNRREMEVRRREERNVIVYKNETDSYYDNYANPQDSEYGEEYDPEWTTIEKKPKKELTLEEKIERDIQRETDERSAAQDASVWNESASNDWDYRDRRGNN